MKGDLVGPEVYFDILQTLEDSGSKFFLCGGQSVNFWSVYFWEKYQGSSGLEKYIPFVSKDCDIWVTYEAFKQFELASGKLEKSESPADGQLAIYTLPGENQLRIDLMTMVYGIPMHEIPRALKRAQKINKITVLDPIYLLKAKCHNLIGLPQSGRQDAKHVGMLTCIVPAYFSTLYDEFVDGCITDRQLIKEIKLLDELCKIDAIVKQCLDELEKTVFDLLPLETLKNTGSEKLARYINTFMNAPATSAP